MMGDIFGSHQINGFLEINTSIIFWSMILSSFFRDLFRACSCYCILK